MTDFAEQWLPRPQILHPYPYLRFDAKYLRQEPHAGKLPVRVCAGGDRQLPFLPRLDVLIEEMVGSD